MRVLTVNAGSSSLKLRLLDDDDTVVFTEDLAAHAGRFDLSAARASIIPYADRIDSVGHRVVHGGTVFTGPVVIDAAVDDAIRGLTSLAPLHQPKSLAGITLVRQLLPDLPAVACFDTAFHAALPDEASTYAVPEVWRRDLGVRRFGFHGLSHQYASRRGAELVGGRAEGPADRLLPPRCWGFAGGSGERTIGRYHHGIHAPGRTGHGDPLRHGRSGHGHVACAVLWARGC